MIFELLMQEFKKKNNKKMHGSGETTLIISNKEMNIIMKIVQAREDSNILLKQLKMKQKNKKEDFKYVIRYFRS